MRRVASTTKRCRIRPQRRFVDRSAASFGGDPEPATSGRRAPNPLAPSFFIVPLEHFFLLLLAGDGLLGGFGNLGRGQAVFDEQFLRLAGFGIGVA